MKEPLVKATKFTLVQAALADGQSDPDGSSVDMAGYDGCLFAAIVGTITTTGTANMVIKQSDDDGSLDDYTAISGATATASAAAQSDRMLIIDIYQPNKRYLRPTLTRATANSIIGGIIAIRYMAKDRPITQATGAGGCAVAAVSLVNSTE